MPTPFLSNFEEEAKLETMALGPDDAFDAFSYYGRYARARVYVDNLKNRQKRHAEAVHGRKPHG